MMMKKVAIILFCLMASMNGMAQTKKAITLNDVIPGGTNFRNLRPEYVYTAWWGDECVELTVDACSKVDKKTGKVKAVAPGRAIITFKPDNKAYKSITCVVKVK